MLAMVEDIRAPSNDRLSDFTLSIYKLISITILEDIDLLLTGSTFFSNRTRLYLLGCSGKTLLLTVGFVDDSTGFFLKSTLLSLMEAEYLVLAYLV